MFVFLGMFFPHDPLRVTFEALRSLCSWMGEASADSLEADFAGGAESARLVNRQLAACTEYYRTEAGGLGSLLASCLV